MPSHRIRVVLALVAILLPASVSAQPIRTEARSALDAMSPAVGTAPLVAVSRTGVVTFLRARESAPIPVGTGSPVERADGFLAEYGSAFGLEQGVEMAVLSSFPRDEVGMDHVRYRQTYRGIPVTGGELSVHMRDRGVVAVNANTVVDLRGVDVVPVVTAEEARVLAADALARSLGVTDATLSEPRLELLNKGHLGGRGFATVLAWFVEARRIDVREYLWIDARHGKTVLQFSQLTSALDREIHDADDPGDGLFNDLPGTLLRVEGGPAIVGPTAADANAAYDYSGDTYDYFMNEHGRDSYDGAGATLISTVRFCPNGGSCPYANAFWNGIQMVYGAGFPAADDVDAHELTHAVTEHTANLFYYMQSGALNESFSDIFGEAVDLLNGAGTDTAGVRWQMGEDVPGFGAIRDMEDPTIFGDPGKSSDPQFVCGDPGGDQGGVHSNSGVPNKAFYLMVDGASYNGQTVNGIGLVKAGKIQYRALSRYLLSASDFLDDYNALLQSCQDLIGTAGITSGDCSEVQKALDAVEMASTWPCSPGQANVPTFCPVGQGPDLWYHEDFEAPAGLSVCPSNALPTAWCENEPGSLFGSFATSGVRSLWGYNRPTTGTMGVELIFDPATMPPANAHFQFNHSYGFENDVSSNYDGGQVRLTTDGGSTWSDAGGLISGGQSYTGSISNSFGNPLGGQPAFVRDSYGYTATQIDLSSLSGTTFGFRFQIGTDSVVDEYGWFVDDLRIYTCPTCLANRTLDGAYTGMAPLYRATNTITAGDGYTVQPGEYVTFEVGGSVVLTDGFVAVGDFTVITGSGVCP